MEVRNRVRRMPFLCVAAFLTVVAFPKHAVAQPGPGCVPIDIRGLSAPPPGAITARDKDTGDLRYWNCTPGATIAPLQPLIVPWHGFGFSFSTGFLSSTTKFTSPTDAYKTQSNTGAVSLLLGIGSGYGPNSVGTASVGRDWYPIPSFRLGVEVMYGRLEGTVGAVGGGSFDQTFNAFPAGNYSGTVTGGTLYHGVADVGMNVLQAPGFLAGPFIGYQITSEALGGARNLMPDVSSTILDTQWQALRVGLGVQQSIFGNGVVLGGTIAALPVVRFNSGTFVAEGAGVTGEVKLSFPLATPYVISIVARDTYMKVSGDTGGAAPTPLDVKNNVFYGGLQMGVHFGY